MPLRTRVENLFWGRVWEMVTDLVTDYPVADSA